MELSSRLQGTNDPLALSPISNLDHAVESGKDLPLKDMVVYPEIYSNETNISETSYGYLEKLGAKIEKRLNKKCNVIIWKDGPIKTIEKAREYGIPVVNSLWLEDCVENFHLADIQKYSKNLPTETEMPFLALQETKKRKVAEALNEDEPFTGIPPELMKRSLKKKKKSSDGEEMGERVTLRFGSLNDDSDKKKDDKTLRRSQTTKQSSLGSWLLTINEKDAKNSKEKKESNKVIKSGAKEKSTKDNLNDESQTCMNIESIFQKKKEEENSARVRSMILKYSRSGSLGALEEHSMDVDGKQDSEDDDKSDDRSSKENKTSSSKLKWESKADNDSEDSNSNSRSKMSAHRSFSLGEPDHSSLLKDEPNYAFRTRIMLREERQNFEKNRLTEGRDKKDGSLDIGVTAREELIKKEGSNFGRISEIWSKYTGKSDPKLEAKPKDNKDNKEYKLISTDEKKDIRNRMQVEEKVSRKEKSPSRNLARANTQKSSKMEESSEEESGSDDDIVVNSKSRLSKKFAEETPKKTVEKKTPIQMSKSLTMETPAKKSSSTTTLKQTSDMTKSSRSDQNTRASTETKTPPTKEAFSLTKSSIIGKYLGSASSNVSAPECTPFPFSEDSDKGSAIKKKDDTKKGESGGLGLRNNGVRSLVSELDESLKKSTANNKKESTKRGGYEEKKDDEKLSKSKEMKEEEMLTKTIKKKGGDEKKEDLVLFTGLTGKSRGRAEEFCKKFNLKLIEDDLRNLQRADFLVYEGYEMPKNYRAAFTMLRGKPIVNKEWIEESLQKGKLIDYKEHEYCYSIEVRKKLLAGLRFYIDKEFEGLTGNMVLKKDLVNLLEQANGKILDNVRSCDFCVMKKIVKKSSEIPSHVKIITSQWIIDSIIEGKLLNTDEVTYKF